MALNAKSIKYKDTSSYKELLDIVWPVGSTYLTTSDISPSQTLGGTWVEKKDGMIAACGSGTIYSGRGKGETQGSYTLTVSQMPSHNHTASSGIQSANHTHKISDYILSFIDMSDSTSWRINRLMTLASGNGSYVSWNSLPPIGRYTTGTNSANHTHSITVNSTGQGQAYIPYSYSFHCWVRTA